MPTINLQKLQAVYDDALLRLVPNPIHRIKCDLCFKELGYTGTAILSSLWGDVHVRCAAEQTTKKDETAG